MTIIIIIWSSLSFGHMILIVIIRMVNSTPENCGDNIYPPREIEVTLTRNLNHCFAMYQILFWYLWHSPANADDDFISACASVQSVSCWLVYPVCAKFNLNYSLHTQCISHCIGYSVQSVQSVQSLSCWLVYPVCAKCNPSLKTRRHFLEPDFSTQHCDDDEKGGKGKRM